MAERYIERYTPASGTELAAELLLTGLLLQVNAMLHPHGLALGITVDGNGKVLSLDLHEDADQHGIWFDEAAVIDLHRRLDRAGLIRRRRAVAGRDDTEARGQASPYRDALHGTVRAEHDR